MKLYRNLLDHNAQSIAIMGLTAPIIDTCYRILQAAAQDPERLIGGALYPGSLSCPSEAG
jgi:hypothetical protein